MKSQNLILALLGLAAVFGPACGTVISPLAESGPTASSVATATLIGNFESQAMSTALGGLIDIDKNADNSSMTVSFLPEAPAATFFWDMSGTAGAASVAGSTLPGGTPGRAIRMAGTLGKDTPPSGPWAWAQMRLILNDQGTDINLMAPTRKLTFSYKAGPASVGKLHQVILNDKTITNYNWFRHTFTPATQNWTAVTVNFTVGTPKFASSWTPAPAAFDAIATNVTRVVFGPVSNSSAPFSYDLAIDDVWFQ